MLEPHLKSPYYLVTQLTLERSLPKNLFVTVSYDINRGVKPGRTRDINAPLPETGIRPVPDQGQIVQLQSSGLSWQQHLKVTMRQRFSIFNVTANYTYFHGLSDQEVGARRGRALGKVALPTNSYDLTQEWGNTGRPSHMFFASLNSRLPLDVYLTTAIHATSGTYYTITTGRDDNQDGAINDRPPGVPKNSAAGPHFFDISFNISKAFDLNLGGTSPRASNAAGSGPQMNVFANLNNAFNMTHLGTPSGVMSSPFFMRSFNATLPRTIEVGMRFQF